MYRIANVTAFSIFLYSESIAILKGFLWKIWLRDQYSRFHNNQIMQTTWQTDAANSRFVFSEGGSISDFYTQMAGC